MGTGWSKAQLQILKRRYARRRFTLREIAEAVGHSYEATKKQAQRLGLRRPVH